MTGARSVVGADVSGGGKLVHVLIAVATLWAGAAEAATVQRVNKRTVIDNVAVDRVPLHAVAGESVRLSMMIGKAGELDAVVLDRDGFPVRTLATARRVAAGRVELTWDGRDDAGAVVPDEAYSFKVRWSDDKSQEFYFPANRLVEMQSIEAQYYSRASGAIVYTLPVASRVHLQIGTSVKNPRTGKPEGPVLKTLVNREPRSAGRIAEQWNGFDETGQVNVADLPNVVLAIAATPLPENSVITIGNRSKRFLEYAASRRGSSVFTYRVTSHAHHAGLTALDDVSPPLMLEPLNASWSETQRAWVVSGEMLKVRLTIGGVSAARFAEQPGELYEFVNGRQTKLSRIRRSPAVIDIPARLLERGMNHITINWRSAYGAVAVTNVRVVMPMNATSEGALR